jgi:hypothetical protein
VYPFLPDSPFTIAYALVMGGALAFVFPFGDARARLIGLVMLADWLGTRAATAWGGEATALVAAGVDLSAALLLAILVPGRPAKLIAALFGVMLAFYILKDAQLLGYEQMWAAADLLAYIQIALMVAAGIDGLRDRVAYRGDRGTPPVRGSWAGLRTAAAPSQRRDLAGDRLGD